MFDVIIKGFADPINNSETKGMMTANMSVKDILETYDLDQKVNRDLSRGRIPSLVKYIEGWKDSLGIFFPALVFSYRGDFQANYDGAQARLILKGAEKIVVLDGQHRIHALKRYISNLQDESSKVEFLMNQMTVQIYFGLTIDEEKTLFSDINSNAKRFSTALITQYDSRDLINGLVHQLYISSESLKQAGVEIEKNLLVRPGNKAFCTGTRLKKFVSYLLYNKPTLQKKEEEKLKCSFQDVLTFLMKFFDKFFDVLPQEAGDVTQYVLGHEAIQNAIAKYLNGKIVTLDDGRVVFNRGWETEIEALKLVDWSISNSDWERWMVMRRTTSGGTFSSFPHPSIRGVIEYIDGELS